MPSALLPLRLPHTHSLIPGVCHTGSSPHYPFITFLAVPAPLLALYLVGCLPAGLRSAALVSITAWLILPQRILTLLPLLPAPLTAALPILQPVVDWCLVLPGSVDYVAPACITVPLACLLNYL